MSDRTVQALPPTAYTFTTIANGAQFLFIPAHRVPTCGAKEVTLIARLHAGTSILAGQSLVCALLLDAFTLDDPAVAFHTALNTSTFTSFTGAISSATVQYVAADASAGVGYAFGSHVAVGLTVNQAAGGGAFTVVLSLDLEFKGTQGRAGPGIRTEFLGYA